MGSTSPCFSGVQNNYASLQSTQEAFQRVVAYEVETHSYCHSSSTWSPVHRRRLSPHKFRAYFYICVYIFRVMTHRWQPGHVLTRAAPNCRVETEIRSELYAAAGVVTKRDTLARPPPTRRSSLCVINQSCVELTGENEAVELVLFKGPRPIPLLIGFQVTEGHTSCH